MESNREVFLRMKENEITAEYLNDNHLWDSEWLMKKYPENHLIDPEWFEKQKEENK